MNSLRLDRTPSATPLPPAKPAASAPAAPTAQAADSLQLSKPAGNNDALAVIDQASALPPMPTDAAAQKAWLTDGFTRLLKAYAAQKSLEQAWNKGQIDGDSLNTAWMKVDALEQSLKQSPQYDTVKQSFFAALVAPAQQLLAGLKSYPAPPASKAGKAQWLAQGKQKLAQAQAAQQVLSDAWFRYQTLPFDKMADGNDAIFRFQSRLDDVAYELNPPKPSKAAPGRDSWTPMQNTQAVANAISRNGDPITATVGTVVLPIAMLVDTIDLLTKPFELLSGQSRRP